MTEDTEIHIDKLAYAIALLDGANAFIHPHREVR